MGKAQAEHVEFDELHGKLLALLEMIEEGADWTLAGQRFDIMEGFGYEIVVVATDPVVVPFRRR